MENLTESNPDRTGSAFFFAQWADGSGKLVE
jgi:hypothetical protein